MNVTVKATSQESEVRLLLRAGLAEGLTAKVLFRPVESNQAVVEILGEIFTIDASRRLVNAGLRLDSTQRRSTLRGKTGKDVQDYFTQFPKLSAEDFR
jgi:hypothetical protein